MQDHQVPLPLIFHLFSPFFLLPPAQFLTNRHFLSIFWTISQKIGKIKAKKSEEGGEVRKVVRETWITQLFEHSHTPIIPILFKRGRECGKQ